MKKHSFLVVMAVIVCAVFALCFSAGAETISGSCGANGDNLTWVLYENGELVISGEGAMADYSESELAPWEDYLNLIKKVKIDAGVTYIGDYAFAYCSALISVDIPDSVTVIGDCAFRNCELLAGVDFSDFIIEIGEEAFSWCSLLATVEIPQSVTVIGERAFAHSASIESFTVDSNNLYYSNDENGVLFDKDKTKLIQYPADKLETSYTIPDSVTEICADAFYWCNSLRNVVIGENVSSIGVRAFYGCENLESIDIPDNVETIGDRAFNYCEALAGVTFGDSVMYIGNYSFYGCRLLESVDIPDSVATIGDCAFEYCTSLNAVTVYSRNATFGASAFGYADANLTIYGYADSTAETYASENDIPFVALDAERTVIAQGTCGANGDNLTWVLYSDGDLVISGSGAMKDYGRFEPIAPWDEYRSSIKTVTIEDGVTNIGDYAFGFCNALTNVRIGDSVTTICSNAFVECPSLKNVEFGDSLRTISDHAFYVCISLEKAELPASVEFIGEDAFGACFALNSITVDAGNAYYSNDEYGVLFNKDKTTLIRYPMGNTRTEYSIPNGVQIVKDFAHSTSLVSVEIPGSVVTIGETAFWWCTSLESVEIPESVEVIGDMAFGGCSSLAKAVILSTDVTFDPDIFGDVHEDFAIHGYAGSTAEAYATANNHQFVALAEREITAQGTCGANGDNLTWVLYSDGELVISGEGAMKDYPSSGLSWHDYSSFIKTVIIDNNVTSIGENAFRNCRSLVDIDFGNGLTTIGADAFNQCNALESVEIPNSVITIDAAAFANCPMLKTAVIGDNVNTIGEFAFRYCTALESIEIPVSVTAIGNQAFYNCSSLTDATVLSKNVSFGEDSYLYCHDTFILHGYNDSTAKIYASDNEIFFASLDGKSVVAQGECGVEGDSVTWTLYDDCELVISGNGAINSYLTYAIPWRSYSDHIKKVVIEEGVTNINRSAFDHFEYVKSVDISCTVTSIGNDAFYGCASLERITVDAGNSAYLSDATGVLYDKNKTVLIAYPAGNPTTEYSIPVGVEKIGRNAFYSCSNLTNIVIPEGVKEFDFCAFCHCNGITSLTIPESVTKLGMSSVFNCGSLTKVTILSREAVFGNNAVYNSNVAITIYGYSDSTAKIYAIENGIRFVSLDGGDDITSGECGENANWEIDADGQITISGSGTVTGLPFEDWDYENYPVVSIVIEEGITVINEYAFKNIITLEEIVIPESVTVIGDRAFEGCESLEEIRIPHSVTEIGEGAFYGCSSLEEIRIPEGVTQIGEGAFANCTSLAYVFIYSMDVEFAGNVFADCSTAIVVICSIEADTVIEMVETYSITYKFFGDSNGDHAINARDAARILQAVAGWAVESDEVTADANGDGVVNARDAARILQYIAGWNVTLG